MAGNKKLKEYNRGLNSGLQMAYRLLRDAGEKKAADLVAHEIRMRGVMKITPAITLKELDEGGDEIRARFYETFLCQTMMVLHDQFDFGRIRCLRFLDNWNLKSDSMMQGLVTWKDSVEWVKEVLDIDLPTKAMEEGGLYWKEKQEGEDKYDHTGKPA